jgi:SAM-dependent methyltransferase
MTDHQSLAEFDFVAANLPPAPARILEVGCGEGRLTRALIDLGYDAHGIDPRAPDGPDFERIPLEELRVEQPYDAAVAVVSLHHLHDLPLAIERLADALAPGGLLVIDEFDRARLDPATTAWLWRQRQALAAVGLGHAPDDATAEAHHAALVDGLAAIFTWDTVRDALVARFDERSCERVGYLYRYETHPALQPLEQAMIDAGAVDATGVRYVGVRR